MRSFAKAAGLGGVGIWTADAVDSVDYPEDASTMWAALIDGEGDFLPRLGSLFTPTRKLEDLTENCLRFSMHYA
eukprot:COSAG05_NODE_927_length_6569_cov_13.038485_8_plen_74_part_00